MSHALSKGRYPRQPDRTAVLAICREDFRKFKEKEGNIILEHLSTLITDLERRGIDPEIYKKQKGSLEEVKSLIEKKEIQAAFTRFTRTFPYCMPHRSLL